MGGLGLTLGQLLFVVPLAAVIGATTLAAVSWAAADQGVPTGMLMRPSLGVAGSWAGSTVIAVLYLSWAALEMQAGGRALVSSLDRAGIISMSDVVGIGFFVVATAALVFVGLSLATKWWIRRFAFWGVMILFLFTLLAVLGSFSDGVLTTVPRQQGFWLGVDMVVAAMVVWYPLAGDTGRFAADPAAATSGTGYGFGVGTAGAVMVGGLAGLTRVIEPSVSGVTAAVLTTTSTLLILVVVVGILVAQLDQPFGLIYGAATSISSTVLRRPPGFLGEGLVVAAGAAAILVTESSLARAVDFLAAIVAPLVAIFIADFYIVRNRRYLTDGLYDRSGPYRGVNLLGLGTFLVAFALMQWVEPSGPDVWVDTIADLVPAAGEWALSGVPPVMLGMVVAFVVYAGIGRWRFHEAEQVSSVRL